MNSRLLPYQVDSLPLSHLGSPLSFFDEKFRECPWLPPCQGGPSDTPTSPALPHKTGVCSELRSPQAVQGLRARVCGRKAAAGSTPHTGVPPSARQSRLTRPLGSAWSPLLRMQRMGGRGTPALRSTPGSWPQAPSQRAGWHKCVPTAECPDKHCPWTGGLVSTNKGRCVQPWVCPLVSTPGQGNAPRPLGADTSPQGSFPSPLPPPTHKPHQEPSQHPACPSCGGGVPSPQPPRGPG